MSDPTRYDLWMLEVTDPVAAMDALTEALGDRDRARDAVLSTPAMLLHGASAEEMQALSTRLSTAGVTLEARPSRRPAPLPVSGALSPGASAPQSAEPVRPSGGSVVAAAPPRPSLARTPPGAGDQGVAKVSYSAALVAAPAYLLQSRVLGAVLALALVPALLLVVPGVLVGLFHVGTMGAGLSMLLVTLAIVGLYGGVFALIVRRSHAGQTDLRMEDESSEDLWAATARFWVVTVLTYAPIGVAGCLVALSPTLAGMVVAGLLVLLALVLAVALPGTYAAAALGRGCASVTPLSGLSLMMRIPGPYILTLVYLWTIQLMSSALSVVPNVAMMSSLVAFTENPVRHGTVLALCVLLMMVIFAASLVISARVLGLLTYHYSEELGL